ncbi:hypothetical protein [Actinomyces culturomici]|uniref:hypothetical protein n=1 Tax=Actinomyces culturomici TaxID=1926276 RepID=UPI000E2076F7|nr:hypothetical protein [Actinomyces culturomici]
MDNTDNAQRAPREVELIFDDEPGRSSSRGRASDGAPRFAQSARAGESPRASSAYTSFPGASYGGPAAADEAGAGRSTVALSEGRIPTGVLAGGLAATAVAGIFAANASGAVAVPGVTTLLSAASTGVLASSATLLTAAFSSVGAILLVLVAWTALRSRGERAAASALMVSMWTAWMLAGAVGSVALGTVPYVVAAIAFPAALVASAAVLLSGRSRAGFWGAVLGGSALVVGAAALLVAAGSATLVGAVASALVGVSGALLGVKLWNRWWAPMIDARERMSRMMNSAWGARVA